MKELILRTRAWYGDSEKVFAVPDGWHLEVMHQHDAPALSDDAVRAAFRNPIGSARVSRRARGKRSAADMAGSRFR